MKIKGLYETHLFVENLERSLTFYRDVLGLELGHYEESKNVAFLWIGKDKKSFLGLWEKPKEEIDIRHFAFEVDADWVLNESVNFLKTKNIDCYNIIKDGTQRPMVFAWIPAISIYFDDPDGHSLEFIGVLPGKSKPGTGSQILPYDEWKKMRED